MFDSLTFNCLIQEREQELEQLTKELRQVNLQQFIQQTGTKVTVLPADPGEEEANTGTNTYIFCSFLDSCNSNVTNL